jgi:hypothetical protein
MFNIFRGVHVNRILLSISLSSFALTQAIPLHALQEDPIQKINAQNILGMVRLEKAVEKFMKSKKKGSKEIISCLKEVKKEIETSFNVKFNTDSCFNMVRNEIRRQGIGVSDRQFSIYRSMLKDKKIISKGGRKNDKEDQEQKEVPTYLVFGITCSLVGFFLMCTKIPVLVTWGERLVTMGVGACAKALSDVNDENEEERKRREKEQNAKL